MTRATRCSFCGRKRICRRYDSIYSYQKSRLICNECDEIFKSGDVPRWVGEPSKLSIKLAKRIKDEFGIEVKPIIKRLYTGWHQKATDGWLWSMEVINGVGLVGSCDTATECANSEKLLIDSEIGHHELFAETKKVKRWA